MREKKLFHAVFIIQAGQKKKKTYKEFAFSIAKKRRYSDQIALYLLKYRQIVKSKDVPKLFENVILRIDREWLRQTYALLLCRQSDNDRH